ncbi:hypothetical protein AAG570_002975 [Ranatra chinensis]|uniref:Transforming acidic coiled-coil-containing protein C-terminal domain-containing protein n=1 Tax=Ranatra chinensis TaxID=642074 RepID=A0ABD0YS62_9HEMI
MIMEEYEKTISQLVTKREDEKKDFEKVKEQIAAERDAALKHLSNMEVAFNDVHQKYERCKTVIENMKVNEASYKESLDANQKAIAKLELDYQKLKKHASEKLEIANEELAGLRKTHSSELARLEAINRKSELSVKSLEESLVQKQKEIRELTQICDELIGKFGNN